jgi:hypothetical protein
MSSSEAFEKTEKARANFTHNVNARSAFAPYCLVVFNVF